eukprot:TRINITY_DN9184_c0_g1_i1.p3 TRINITY_DN9184_c0_g1~~TRINITY_DN9184_c0_g1_i1.p3  ORF type:complete len:103 (-),score=14.95 TRINITY_DN9184_c0_g1_i1:266-574(-)
MWITALKRGEVLFPFPLKFEAVPVLDPEVFLTVLSRGPGPGHGLPDPDTGQGQDPEIDMLGIDLEVEVMVDDLLQLTTTGVLTVEVRLVGALPDLLLRNIEV